MSCESKERRGPQMLREDRVVRQGELNGVRQSFFLRSPKGPGKSQDLSVPVLMGRLDTLNERKMAFPADRFFHWQAGGILVLFLFVFLIPSCQEKAPSSSGGELNLRAPVALTIAFLNETTVLAEWIDPNDYSTINRGDVRYEIQMSTDSLVFRRISVTPSDSTRTIITYGFSEDSTYYFRIRILAPEAVSPFSLVRYLTPIPHARIDLAVTAVSETTVTLQWSVVGSSVVRTIIERKAGTGGTFTPVESVDGSPLSFEVRGPYHVDTAYYFRVQTVSDLQVHSYSDTAVAVLFFYPPYELHASFIADTAVSLTWKLDNPHAQRVVVECRYWIGGSYVLSVLDTVSAGQTSTILPGRFIVDREYFFQTYALSTYNRSSYSRATGLVFHMYAPTDFHVTALSPSAIEFAWMDATPFETSFELLQSINDSAFAAVGSYPENASSGVLPVQGDWDLFYKYRIRARSTYNVSPASNGVLVFFDQSMGLWTWASIP